MIKEKELPVIKNSTVIFVSPHVLVQLCLIPLHHFKDPLCHYACSHRKTPDFNQHQKNNPPPTVKLGIQTSPCAFPIQRKSSTIQPPPLFQQHQKTTTTAPTTPTDGTDRQHRDWTNAVDDRAAEAQNAFQICLSLSLVGDNTSRASAPNLTL